MAYSKIVIEFLEVPNENEFLNIFEYKLGLNLNEVFKNLRFATGQTKLPLLIEDGVNTSYYKGSVSINYKNAINLDYNASNLFTVAATNTSLGVGTVTITANYEDADFTAISVPPSVNVVVTNEVVSPPEFYFVSDSFSPAATPNTHVRVNVTTSELANKITSPVLVNGNTSNPFYVDILRRSTNVFTAENASGVSASKTIVAPKILDATNFNVVVNSSPNGGTMTINEKVASGLTLQYSLDNINFQNENVFSGLEDGDFTLYVKDTFGALITIAFTVTEFGIYTPYCPGPSKSNSIRFANRINWGDSANYKTDENTLSNEVDVLLPDTEIQRFQSADIISTQFKSNYTTNSAKIVKCDLSEVDIPVVKMTNNIGIKDKRDARKYDLGNGKTGIYFISGNIYNYDTNGVEDTYALNGSITEWAEIGNYIIISNAWFLIEEIVFDENKNADVIVFTNNYSGSEVNVIVGSIFNRFNYEVYEFAIDMVDYIDQKFRVRINNLDPSFTEVIHLSEIIYCKVKHEKVLEIKYRNSTNTDVLYSTGIEHKIRIPYIAIKGKSDASSEVHKTDTDAILLNADLYEVNEIQFQPVTREIWRKIMIALSHEKVSINEVGYVKNGDFNTEGPLGDTDSYVLTATMIKTGNVYNSQTSGNLDFDGSAVEVPGLISTETGFLSY